VRINDNGELLFQGQNACIGQWTTDGLYPLDPERWVATGDRAERRSDGLYFQGRTDSTFKLANGRMVHAGPIEARIKEGIDDVHDAFVWSPNGTELAIAFCWDASPAQRPTNDAMRPYLGPLHKRLDTTLFLAPADWPQTPKGAVDRMAIQQRLADLVSSHSSSVTS
jgi:acyl-coenzyme A synthetase/AMP-(fatty) acid ligase